jgi:alkaline phosphatase
MTRRLSFLLALVLFVCHAAGAAPRVILMIGDGMGVGQLGLALDRAGSLRLQEFPVAGLQLTASADNKVTDSAAAGTCLATGVRTNNKMIGLSAAGDTLTTVLEIAASRGLGTGLVATCRVTHATPASFASHVDHRDKEHFIANHLAAAPLDVLFGYGYGKFLPLGAEGSSRPDDTDLRPLLEKRFPSRAFSPAEYEAMAWRTPALALLDSTHGPDAPGRSISLERMTRDALALLDTKPGFFLMVEGSRIDWAGHSNDTTGVLVETLDFDRAVGAALDFARRDGNTLVVVTADHETGGLTLPGAGPAWSTKHHTSTPVPILAFGPGAEHFGGVLTNARLGQTLIALVEEKPVPGQ